MKCPRCEHENPQGARFCEECATPLARTCSNCGTALSATAKFCHACAHPVASGVGAPSRSPESYTPKHLAEKIFTSKAALEGERKQVTVLFADLKGSMELLADRDPEEARKLLDPVLERMMEAVHHYEGTVNQVMGDGIMALFGAPIGHEDHAVRACYAALRMQDSVKRYAEVVQRTAGVPVQIRVGLNSGEVVVRAIGSDLHMDYTAVGQTTHLAARMEQMAMAGSILLSADALRLAEGFVEVKPLGPVNVKGLSEPVEVYEVTGVGPARTRLQAATRRGLTRFVGRDAEVEHLRRVLGQAGAGRGQVVAIVGEAGVGKSRLTYEFTHSHRVQDWLILEASSVSYGKATSYLPVIDLLKGYFKIGDRDNHREMRDKVMGRVLGLDRALEPLLPPLLALLDVPVEDPAWQTLDPPQRRQRTLDAIKRLLLRESQVQPLLVVFEDLHWVDGETQVLLDNLVDSLGSARLLLLVNYRPEYQHGWSSKTAYSQLRLDALPAESAGELLEALLGNDPGLAPLKQLLIRRGNPFFLEETVRTLVETEALAGERGRYRLAQPIQTLQVPPTVQTILAARIDRLSPEDKQLLQVASVVGKDVPFTVLQAIAGLPDDALRGGLDRLQAAEFLYEAGLYPDLEYSFKHALTHDVTHGGLLQERRRELHARIVEAIETLHRDRLGEHIEWLAHHAFRAEAWDKAREYLRRAGQKAVACSANRAAVTWFEQTLRALSHLPDSSAVKEEMIDVRLELRVAVGALGQYEHGLDVLLPAEALARELGDRRRLGWVCAALCMMSTQSDRDEQARRFGGTALALGRELNDPGLQAVARNYLTTIAFNLGEPVTVVNYARETIALLPETLTRDRLGQAILPSVSALHWMARGLAQLGAFDEGITHARRAIELAETVDHPYSTAVAWAALGHLYTERGDFDQARAWLERSLAQCRNLGFRVFRGRTSLHLGEVHARAGHLTEALSLLDEASEMFVAVGRSREGLILTARAEAYLYGGRLDEARACAERALAWARGRGQRAFEPGADYVLGLIASRSDTPEIGTGTQHLQRARAVAGEVGRRPLVAHCHLGLGKLYRRTDNREQAQEHLTSATAMYREMGMTYWLEKAEAEISGLT